MHRHINITLSQVLKVRMSIDEETIDSLSTYVRRIEELRATAEAEFWYRGVKRASYPLKPTLFRHTKYKNISEITELETNLYNEFCFQSPSFVSVSLQGAWDTLFLMQHYRIPTRLLDWTLNPFAALFFAIDGHNGKDDAAVWLLKPKEWNRGVLSDIGGPAQIYNTDEEILNQYHPDLAGSTRRSEPLAIDGIINNARINAQKGKFIVFGHKNEPLEEFYERVDDWDSAPLIKLRIPAKKVNELSQLIFECGITHTSLFPDLEGLAMEIRHKYGF